MIDPNNINTIRVGQLVEAVFSGTDNIPHEVGSDLRRGTINDLVTYIQSVLNLEADSSYFAYNAIPGEQLPAATDTPQWFFAGKGYYAQTNALPDITCTKELNIISSLGAVIGWGLTTEIPITVDPPDAMISQTVNAGVTNYSPSEDAVRTAIDEVTFLNAFGSFNYNDSATQTTPISVTANIEAKLTNDTLGSFTDVSQAPFGVSSIWNPLTNQFDFSQLTIGDWIDLRTDVLIDLIDTNTSYQLYMKMAIGSGAAWTLNIHNGERKSTDEFDDVHSSGFVVGNTQTRDYPAELWILTDAGATVKVNGFLAAITRKNINIVDIEIGDVQLNDLIDVDEITPQDGDALVWSSSLQKYTKGRPTVAVGNSTKFYLDATASLADNFTLSNTPSSYIETADSISVTTGLSPVFFERFVSAPLGKNTIPAGSWTFNIYGSTSNNTGLNVIDFRVNKRVIVNGIVGTWTGAGATRTFTASSGIPFAGLTTSGNRLTAPLIETPNQTGWVTVVNSSTVVTVNITDIGYVNESGVALNAIYYWLFNDSTGDITGTAPTLYTETLVLPEITGLNDNDRLVIAFFATTDQASARTITLYYGGTEHFTHFETPIGTVIPPHNDLTGLNDGDYQHLTTAEKAAALATPDPTIIEDSPNAVAGGAVFDALALKKDVDANIWRPKILEGNTSQQNADLINADINAAKLVNGVVLLPAGNFTTRKINWDPRVLLKGAGKRATTLTSTHAEPLIEYTGNDWYSPIGNIEGLHLRGGVDEFNKIGTTALNIQRVSYFHFKNILIESFAANAVELTGCLIGQFEDINVENCSGGFNAITASTSSIGLLQSNLVKFNNCSFNTINTWAIQWDSAANVQFNFCDFEYCGTNGNTSTGIVKATNFSPAAEGTGLVFNGCWGEFNYGTLFSIAGNAAAKYSFRDSMFQYGTASKALVLNGGSVLIDNSTIPFSVDITSGSVENRTSTIGTVTLAGTSLYKKYQSENFTGTILDLCNPNGDNYNHTTPSSATTYTTKNKVENAFVSCVINSTSEPTVTGATKISGATFVSSTNMEMIVEVKNNAVRYFFLSI